MPYTTIDEIVAALDQIITDCIDKKNPLGYFSALYRLVTLEVDSKTKDGGYFEDDLRMRKMVIVFAGRYLDAYHEFAAGKLPSLSWQAAFKAAAGRNKIVMQHLTLGINAHINLDLGIAASFVAPGENIDSFSNDFNKINQLLFGLVDTMEERLGKISPMMGWVDRFLKNKDELFIGFAMNKARDSAWVLAKKLATITSESAEQKIHIRDAEVSFFGNLIAHPGWFPQLIIFFIRLREKKNVGENIKLLGNLK